MTGWTFPLAPSLSPRQSLIVKSRRNGFTVVELLVISGLTTVLLLITMMVAGKLRSRSQGAACLANIRQLHMLLVAYANDYRGCFPMAEDSVIGTSWVGQLVKAGLLSDVKKTKSVRGHVHFCPGSTVHGPDGMYSSNQGQYGLNRDVTGHVNPTRSKPSLPLAKIRNPAQTILLSDAGYRQIFQGLVAGGSKVTYIPGIPENRNITEKAADDARVERHDGYNNVVMVDGHAERWNAKKFKETRETAWLGQ